ncbi:MAG TPA: 50S ribosomal protein L35 [Actinomycetota bacterium]|jgi:large subunit ribosomal protein L35|nr:50S ribosomal protein L35 [Actinomycetota bacterium]
MPKMKTNRAAAKRFRRTGSGKFVHRKAWGSHLFKSKTKSRQIRLKGNKVVADSDHDRVGRLLGK